MQARVERLVDAKDLFHHEPPVVPDEVPQAGEVREGVGQPVGVVDTYAVDKLFCDQLAKEPVRVLEDEWIFLAHPCEPIDGEEAAVRDYAVAPVHELVRLALVDLERVVVETAVRPRREGKIVVVVGQDILPARGSACGEFILGQVSEAELLLVALLAKHREPELTAGAVVLVPINIKVGGKLGVRAKLEHVPPPAVAMRDLHAHVVWHDVQHDAESGVVCCPGELAQTLDATQLRVNLGRIEDVVAVIGLRHGGEDGGEIEVRYP